MNNIAIIVTTFLRDELLYKTIQNIEEFMPDNCSILIGDQNWTPEKHSNFFNPYLHIVYKQLPYDCGLSYARNFLVQKAYDMGFEYVLLSADSIQFNQKYNFTPYIDFLEKESKRGIIGFELNGSKCCWEFNLELTSQGIKLNSSKESITENNIIYKRVDICRNIFLAKTKTLLNLWDNEMKLAEHELAFIEYKKRGHEVYWTDNISFNKAKEENSTNYDISRKRFVEYKELLKKKLNISGWVIYSPEAMKEIRTYKLNHEEKK
jgi:hypothetical protein